LLVLIQPGADFDTELRRLESLGWERLAVRP
jgi:hypothetical protein